MTLGLEIKKELVKRVLAAAKATRIILFGSFARGDADEESDIDLLVVVEETPSRRELGIAVREAIGAIGFGVDVVVATEEDMRKFTTVPGIIYEEATREGVELYAV